MSSPSEWHPDMRLAPSTITMALKILVRLPILGKVGRNSRATAHFSSTSTARSLVNCNPSDATSKEWFIFMAGKP